MPKTYTIADKEEAKKLIGRKVKVVKCGSSKTSYFGNHNGHVGALKMDMAYEHYNVSDCEFVLSFQLVEKTLDDVEVEDVLVKDLGDRTILARIADVVLLSFNNDPETSGEWNTISYLKKRGYTLKDSSPEKVEKYPICPQCGCNTIVAFARPNQPFKNDSLDYDQNTAELYCCNAESNCTYRVGFSELTTPRTEKKYSLRIKKD